MDNFWKVETTNPILIGEKIENGEIVVPLFQRGVVWSVKQQERLIDSIKKGFPFGTILLYRDNGVDRIIDGLQRLTTIYKFVTNPARFFNEEDLTLDVVENLAKLEGSLGSLEKKADNIKQTIVNWVKDEHPKMENVINMKCHRIAYLLSDKFPMLKNKEREIIELLDPILDKYRKVCQSLGV